jgi:hypothetical protein
MKVKPTISTVDIKLLDEAKYKKFLLFPSSRIYYGTKPYKVCINLLQSTDELIGSSQRYHWWAWQDLIKVMCINHDITVRTQGRFPNMYLFFSHREGVDLCIKNYSSRINYIEGPLNDVHLDKISGSNDIVVRKNLFFNEYPMKVCCWLPWGYGRYSNRQTVIHEIREYIKDNIGTGRLSTCRWKASFFANPDEISDIIPFIKLQWPSLKIDYTEIYYPDSL